eukprot:TRINITY_DN54553_c0_g1_i1.p1 TRINITY_DN54553_c0_g1~~TRINITY_DN54553_c0_g1_i1.p1  ORF type:complete len:399 (-),score=28.65 TRINITY_DN54553_c0_g1_i1:18-1214(-)
MSVNENAVKSEIRSSIISTKVNACPMAIRLAWHASGTFDKNDNTGGSDGSTMRFDPESSDPANAGLSIMRDMLHPVKKNNPKLSTADIWTLAGASAVNFTGGPMINHGFGRTDKPDGSYCPPNGRLPDAAQGAQHLRDVFYRMGFNDQEIVALSGAHTLGRCHISRSGFDGPWTHTSLEFNNEYFKNLMDLEWVERKWDGPLQYEDTATHSLMMLPTDMALKTDPEFKVHARRYADDQNVFFAEFKAAYERLLTLNCPASCSNYNKAEKNPTSMFRDYAMHGSLEKVKEQKDAGADIHAVDPASGRNALHFAAFWGHSHIIEYLIGCGISVNVQDSLGDTALHDAARFAHEGCVKALLTAGADMKIKNNAQQTPLDVATEYSTTSTSGKHDQVIALLK